MIVKRGTVHATYAIFAFSSSANFAASPVKVTLFTRDFWPAVTVTVDFGRSSHVATANATAVFAAPSSGTARTLMVTAGPSAVSITPATSSRDDFGVTRTRSVTPVVVARQHAVTTVSINACPFS
jgi:hypothetical protein